MSTKTIAVEDQVYRKLAGQKREGESFTKAIDRLVESRRGSRTCADAVAQAAEIWRKKPSAAEAKAMEAVVRANRKRVNWSVRETVTFSFSEPSLTSGPITICRMRTETRLFLSWIAEEWSAMSIL